MKIPERQLLYNAGAIALAMVGIAWARNGSGLSSALGFVFFGVGIVAALDAPHLHALFQDLFADKSGDSSSSSGDMESKDSSAAPPPPSFLHPEVEKERRKQAERLDRAHREEQWRYSAGILVIVLVATVLAVAHSPVETATGSSGVSSVLQEIRQQIGGLSAHQSGPGPTVVVPDHNNLQLDPALQTALLTFLRKPAATAFWESRIGITLVIAIVVAFIGTLLLLGRKHESAVPVAGAAGIAAAAITQAEHLSKLSTAMFSVVLGVLLLLTCLLFGVTIRLALAKKEEERDTQQEVKTSDVKGTKTIARTIPEHLPLTTAYSLIVLLWLVVIVGYRGPAGKDGETSKPCVSCCSAAAAMLCPSTREPTCPQAPAAHCPEARTPTGYEIEALPRVTPFASGHPFASENNLALPEEYRSLESRLAAEPHRPGDLVLLLGAADCVHYQKQAQPINQLLEERNNNALALRRANGVKRALESTRSGAGMLLQAQVLPQQANCSAQPENRGVYSFLIHPNFPSQAVSH